MSVTIDIKFFFILSCFISSTVFASLNPKKYDLDRYRFEVKKISARLKSLEKEIDIKKDLYQSSLDKIQKFQEDLDLYKSELSKKKEQVLALEEDNKFIIRSYLLESAGEEEDLWQKKIHLDLLTKSQEKLKLNLKELVQIEKKVNQFDESLTHLKKNELELSSIIKDMEHDYVQIQKNVQEKIAVKKEIESDINKQQKIKTLKRIKKRISQIDTHHIHGRKVERLFSNPIEEVLSLRPSQKGVTYKFKSDQKIKAVGDGRIVFAGNLASYGQVIMIDHGNELRTVLLGKMKIKVNKNDSVKAGDEVAHTLDHNSPEKTLYFEVRKKNTAQNTILWLEQRGISKI